MITKFPYSIDSVMVLLGTSQNSAIVLCITALFYQFQNCLSKIHLEAHTVQGWNISGNAGFECEGDTVVCILGGEGAKKPILALQEIERTHRNPKSSAFWPKILPCSGFSLNAFTNTAEVMPAAVLTATR